MQAAWYDRQGPAGEVLQTGEMHTPQPGPSEVLVKIRLSGINPGDTKKRRGWLGSEMPYPRVVPHSDGAGTIEAVGNGVDPLRVSQRVWVYGAQPYRAFGTAKRQAASDLTSATAVGHIRILTGTPMPLDQIAEAHNRVDRGSHERVLARIPD